jgi:carboxyl-terminal processing protease
VGLNVFGAQQRLAMIGYAVKASGTMDDATVAAVKKFQTENKLYASGTLDYTTMDLLDKTTVDFITGAKNAQDLQLQKAIDLLK